MTPTTGPSPRADRRAWTGLAVLALPTLLLSIDVFVLLLALPHLAADLGADSTQQLWITDIYGFMIAGFLITMGTLGDRIGRRRLLLTGAAAFGASSVLAAFAPTPELLIAARALLGVAGATLAPSTLALISNMFSDARQRASAIGIWLMCFMGGAAIGPVVGGMLLERYWWGSVFLVGVPAMLLLLVLGPVLLPEYRNPNAGRLDLPSVALSLAAILPAIYGLKELAKHGAQPLPAAALAAGVAIGVVFARRQQKLPDPLLDLRLFASRAFSAALGSMLSGTLLMGALMLFVAQYLQLVQGLRPLDAGLWMLPSAIANAASFVVAPLAARRVRPAVLIGGGLTLSVAGLVWMTQVGAAAGPAGVIGGWTVVCLGAGPLVTLATDLVVGSAPPARAGSAAAMNETSGEFGFALGIATLGSLGTAVYRAQLAIPTGVPAAAADTARESLAGAITVAGSLPGPAAAALSAAAREAFTSGLHTVAFTSAVLLAGVAVLAVTLLRHVRPTGQSAHSQPEPDRGSGPEPAGPGGPAGGRAADATLVPANTGGG